MTITHMQVARYARKMRITFIIGVVLAGCLTIQRSRANAEKPTKLLFSFLTEDIKERQEELSDHPFFKMLGDESIPLRKRASFIPHWAFFAFSFADVLDTWIYIPNPQSELEERINMFVREDNFHYNFFFEDMRELGYTLDRFGSFDAVMRHLWSAESRAVRDFIYTWSFYAKKYDDPLVMLATFEAVEAGLHDLFESTATKLAFEKGLKLEYFGGTHVDLERNHTHTGWFKEEEIVSSLEDFEITELQRDNALEAFEPIFDKFHSMYTAMLNMALAEDTIRPEKYQVTDYVAFRHFPREHPNKAQIQHLVQKDEL